MPVQSIVWREPSRPIDPKHVKELAASIEEVGLLHRIGVVDAGGEKYEGRFGRHRFEALKLLGRKEIDVEVLDLDGVGQEIATIHENTKHLDMNPIQRARMFRRYADLRKAQDAKLTQEAIAKELQVSAPELANTLMLLDQEEHVRKLVEDGRLTPGHVEHILAPLAKELPKEAVVKFAHEIAGKPEAGKPALDIRRAKEDGARLLERHRTEVQHEAAMAAAKKAKGKVLICPLPCYGDRKPDKFYEAEGRPVLEHENGYSDTHRWYADTGEPYLTAAERKELERRKIEEARRRKDTAKDRKARGEGGKVLRDYAAFLSKATADEWAQGLLDAARKVGLTEISQGGLDTRHYGYAGDKGDLQVAAKKDVPVPQPLIVTPIAEDGRAHAGAGPYRSRVQFGSFASLPSRRDNIAERADVKDLREARAKVLAFQRAFGVKQADGEIWPAELAGFKLGERVRLGKDCHPSGYAGKEGAILAFDADRDGAFHAVLDVPWPSKLHALATLEKRTKWSCGKCGAKAVVRVVEGKELRICAKCGLAEGKCTCEVRTAIAAAKASSMPEPAKKGEGGRPRKMQTPSRDGGPPPLVGRAKKGKAKKTPKGRGK